MGFRPGVDIVLVCPKKYKVSHRVLKHVFVLEVKGKVGKFWGCFEGHAEGEVFKRRGQKKYRTENTKKKPALWWGFRGTMGCAPKKRGTTGRLKWKSLGKLVARVFLGKSRVK